MGVEDYDSATFLRSETNIDHEKRVEPESFTKGDFSLHILSIFYFVVIEIKFNY